MCSQEAVRWVTDELFLLPQQEVPGCGVRMPGLHLQSSKGSALGLLLAIICFTDAGKPLDLPHCGNKMLLEDDCSIHSSYWKVGCPCEI